MTRAAKSRILALIILVLFIVALLLIRRGVDNWRQQTFVDEALWQAVENGNATAAEGAFARGGNANALGDAGLGEYHTLITAQAHGDGKMVGILLAHGASPSLALAKAFDAKEVGRLLHVGARVNGISDDLGMTPLGEQSANGRPAIVQLLLAHGADPNAKDKDGFTPMDRAKYASANHPEEAALYAQVIRLLTQAEKTKAISPRPQAR